MSDISYEYRPATPAEQERTVLHLRQHTEAAVGMSVTHIPFGLLAYAESRLVGSIVGKIFFCWLHIDLIWVAEERRGQGVGRRLMELALEKAREAGLNGIEVWTQSWQAPGFYRRLGYEEFAVLDDFTPAASAMPSACILRRPHNEKTADSPHSRRRQGHLHRA